MKLSIYSLQKTLFLGEAEKIIARTTSGEITVLENHIPLISALKGPELIVVDAKGVSTTVAISGGFLEVKPEHEVVALVDMR